MELTMNSLAIILGFISSIIFIGAFYGSTKKRLSQIEYDLKKSADYINEIIDKLARIETKLDFITKQK
jgi:hypothetical protein